MQNSVLVPMVVEQTSRGERAFDIYTRAGFSYLRTDPKHGDQVLAKTIIP